MTTALEKIEKDAKLKKDFEKYLKEVKRLEHEIEHTAKNQVKQKKEHKKR